MSLRYLAAGPARGQVSLLNHRGGFSTSSKSLDRLSLVFWRVYGKLSSPAGLDLAPYPMCHFPFCPFPFAFDRLHGERVLIAFCLAWRSLSASRKR